MPILPNPRPAPGTTVDEAPTLHISASTALPAPAPARGLLPEDRRPLAMPVHDGVTYDALGPGTDEGCSYDYRAQTWRDGHDHCHLSTSHPEAVPLYCGADLDTCAPAAPHTSGGTA